MPKQVRHIQPRKTKSKKGIKTSQQDIKLVKRRLFLLHVPIFDNIFPLSNFLETIKTMLFQNLRQKITKILEILNKHSQPTIQQLDPYLVGRVAGPAAFSSGDYVVLTKENNTPAKVRCRNDDIAQSIKVILGDESDSVYAQANYFAADLGYPLSQELWSEHQKLWYKNCHSLDYLAQRWQS